MDTCMNPHVSYMETHKIMDGIIEKFAATAKSTRYLGKALSPEELAARMAKKPKSEAPSGDRHRHEYKINPWGDAVRKSRARRKTLEIEAHIHNKNKGRSLGVPTTSARYSTPPATRDLRRPASLSAGARPVEPTPAPTPRQERSMPSSVRPTPSSSQPPSSPPPSPPPSSPTPSPTPSSSSQSSGGRSWGALAGLGAGVAAAGAGGAYMLRRQGRQAARSALHRRAAAGAGALGLGGAAYLAGRTGTQKEHT